MEDIFRGLGVEIRLFNSEDFLKIKETLTRIGVASRKENKLYQSCHILHKQKRYAIMHFKELFALDGKQTNFTDDDRNRRDTICDLLSQWGLIEVIKQYDIAEVSSHIKIIPFKDKSNWELCTKYTIGRKKI